MLNGLDLFSGIGGITLALGEWVKPVAYCEIDQYAAGVLFSRMLDGSLPTASIFPDITKLTGEILPNIDIIYGGFPCQDISSAGLKAGLEGERSGLFFEIVRLARELRPRFIFLENVAAITVRGMERVISEWTALGYDCRWTILSAAAVGAPHRRERWWLLAHADRDRCDELHESKSQRKQRSSCSSDTFDDGAQKSVADPYGNRCEGAMLLQQGRSSSLRSGQEVADTDKERLSLTEHEKESHGDTSCIRARAAASSWWSTEPDVGRTFNGLSDGMDGGGGLEDGEAEETGANKVLRYLQSEDRAKTIQWAIGGLNCIQAEAFLLAVVREYERGGRLPRRFLACSKTPKEILRAMRSNRTPSCSSCGRQSAEQYFREYPDALRELSQLVASRSKSPWASPLWESSVQRVVSDLSHRVDRIKSLGNSVVPQCAKEAFKRLMGIL